MITTLWQISKGRLFRALVRVSEQVDKLVKVCKGKPLPAGWLGRQACVMPENGRYSLWLCQTGWHRLPLQAEEAAALAEQCLDRLADEPERFALLLAELQGACDKLHVELRLRMLPTQSVGYLAYRWQKALKL